jgi:hypothetical protein
MSGSSQQWAALESQHERLVEVSRPLLRGEAPRRGRKPWHRRIAVAANSANGTSPSARHSRRRAVRPEA